MGNTSFRFVLVPLYDCRPATGVEQEDGKREDINVFKSPLVMPLYCVFGGKKKLIKICSPLFEAKIIRTSL